MLKIASLAIVLLVGAGFAYVRLAPVNAEKFHVDPETAKDPSVRGYVFVRDGADITPPSFDMTRADLAAKVEAVILATPRTVKLAGDLATGHASYVTRSGLWGFPDIASVKITDAGEGASKLVLLSRQIYGIEDLGVNKARVENWLQALAS